MKQINLVLTALIVFSFASCNKSNEITSGELHSTPSKLTTLTALTLSGSSGDKSTSLLGYGFDASGFCDATSAREKIIDVHLAEDRVDIGYWNASGSGPLISKKNYSDLIAYLNESGQEQGYTRVGHLESLLNLAYNSNTIDPKYFLIYFYTGYTKGKYSFNITSSDCTNLLTNNFKNDIASLSPKSLVEKYGTDVLTQFEFGHRFEVLYKCLPKVSKDKIDSDYYYYLIEQRFSQRMNEFFGCTYGLYIPERFDNIVSDEQLIFNTIGGKTKNCGLIEITDNNKDKVFVDVYSNLFKDEDYQLISIPNNGTIPIYELVSDPIKQQELKTYIGNYIAHKN